MNKVVIKKYLINNLAIYLIILYVIFQYIKLKNNSN